MTEPLPRAADTSRPRWPQFGMRALFLFVTGCCVLCALAEVIGPLWALAVGWMVLMTAVHVAGNAWGTRINQERTIDELDPPWPPRGQVPLMHCPPSRLRQHAALGWIRIAVTGLGALAGGAIGPALLWFVGWGEMGYPSLIVGGLSAAVLGGFLGFLSSSFLQVSLSAWSEATLASQHSVANLDGHAPGGHSG